jgi:hypothetical protein
MRLRRPIVGINPGGRQRHDGAQPEISLYLRTFTDGPQHDWRTMLASAQVMDIAGIDRVVVSDHVVFGENLDAYADPSVGGAADLTCNNRCLPLRK